MTPQKITVKIPRKQGELIPFDLEKWNTGEYEAIGKDKRVGRVLCTDNVGNYPIIVAYGNGSVHIYTINGQYHTGNHEAVLFLRKKSSEAELPMDDYLNFDYRGITGIWKSLTELENHALPMRLGSIHITYAWED